MKKEKTPGDEKIDSALSPENEFPEESPDPSKRSAQDSRRRIILIGALIFLVALGCRLLSWHDNRYEARKVQTAVTEGYKHTGRLLQQGGLQSFFSANSPLSDPNHLGHPPGYSILIAVV